MKFYQNCQRAAMIVVCAIWVGPRLQILMSGKISLPKIGPVLTIDGKPNRIRDRSLVRMDSVDFQSNINNQPSLIAVRKQRVG
jgi:hypothetical protein